MGSSERRLSVILHSALPAVYEFEQVTTEYEHWMEDYQKDDAYEPFVEDMIPQVAASWRETDRLKDDLDAYIAERGYTVEANGHEIPVDSVERLLHTSGPLDDDELSSTAAQNYRDLADFNSSYLQALSTIVSLEPVVLEDPAFDRSPEEIRHDEEPDYTLLQEQIQQQVRILREFQDEAYG